MIGTLGRGIRGRSRLNGVLVNDTDSRLVADLALERQQRYDAEHASRLQLIRLAVAVVAVVAATTAVFFMAHPSMSEPLANPGNPAPSSTRSAATEDSEPAGSSPNARGNIPKKLGESAGFGSVISPIQNTFSIERITIDPPCSPQGTRQDAGHTILLHVEVSTGPDAERAGMLGRILAPGFFSAIGPDGVSHDAWPGACTDPADRLPEDFGVNRTYAGTVELNLPISAGTLVLAGDMTNAAGWEWPF